MRDNDRIELGKRTAAAIYWENDPIGQGEKSLARLLVTRYQFGRDRVALWNPEQQDYEAAQLLGTGFYGGRWDDDDNPFREVGQEYAREVVP